MYSKMPTDFFFQALDGQLHEASLRIILLKKQTINLLMILRGCAGWSGPLLLQITEDRFSQSRSNCYMYHLTMTHIRKQNAKYDNTDRIVICNLFKAFSVNI